MWRSKIRKYNENFYRKNIIDRKTYVCNKPPNERKKQVFIHKKPIIVEIWCGYWEYTLWLAGIFSNYNFVWIDIKWDRIAVWARKAEIMWLDNVWFIRTKVHDLHHFFLENTVTNIWLVHPDPRPKNKQYLS